MKRKITKRNIRKHNVIQSKHGKEPQGLLSHPNVDPMPPPEKYHFPQHEYPPGDWGPHTKLRKKGERRQK